MNERVGAWPFHLWGWTTGLPSTTLYSFNIDFDLHFSQVLYGGCLFLSLILLIIGQPPSLVGHEAPCHKSFRLTFSIKFQPWKIRSGILKTTRHKRTFLLVLITIHHKNTFPSVLITTRHKKTFPGVPITIHHKKHPSSCCKHKQPHS